MGVTFHPRTDQTALQHSCGDASSKGSGGQVESLKDSPIATVKSSRVWSLGSGKERSCCRVTASGHQRALMIAPAATWCNPRFFGRLLERVRAVPGVTGAAAGSVGRGSVKLSREMVDQNSVSWNHIKNWLSCVDALS